MVMILLGSCWLAIQFKRQRMMEENESMMMMKPFQFTVDGGGDGFNGEGVDGAAIGINFQVNRPSLVLDSTAADDEKGTKLSPNPLPSENVQSSLNIFQW